MKQKSFTCEQPYKRNNIFGIASFFETIMIYAINTSYQQCRGVVPGDSGGALAPPDFGRLVKPISTRGKDNAHLISTGTPGFSDLPTALQQYV